MTFMNILIIGNGGREHALAWKVKQSPLVSQVFVAPGNGGTALETGVQNITIAPTDISKLLAFAQQQSIDLTIVGPEAALAAGVVDAFTDQGLRCFGPTKAAAQLETSKVFSKQFMLTHHIPTARYASFTDLSSALAYIQHHPYPLVIKADGLAAGKGVVIAHDLTQATATLQHMLSGQMLGDAGERVIIEEFLEGEEASFIVISDGKFALPLASSQDHKARDNGDMGPNTGGMGAYSPASIITPTLQQQILDQIIYPTLQGMAALGLPYHGFLYAGLMITRQGQPKVLEFNCRLGDPETQPILLRLQSDLAEACIAALEHRLEQIQLKWDPRPALGVVLTAKGYPGEYPQNETILGLAETGTEGKLFHAGTKLENDLLKTAGGRVLCATSLGRTVLEAQQKAYRLAATIQWPHQYYRTDIGYRAIAREHQPTVSGK